MFVVFVMFVVVVVVVVGLLLSFGGVAGVIF